VAQRRDQHPELTVDHGDARKACTARHRHHGQRSLLRAAKWHGDAVWRAIAVHHHVGVEHSDQALQIPAAQRRRERVDHTALRRDVCIALPRPV
jgi:hypothetical protein